ncbi:MAG: hypothetical protein K2R98_17210 [Gemmataceae bacterium]|nr:hypothetical protein [Gemmataceae bacterium]
MGPSPTEEEPRHPLDEPPPAEWSVRGAWAVAAVIAVATLALHARPLAHPMLLWDDFQILAHSWTWEATAANFWAPHNEHTMPLGRLSTWLLGQLAGTPSNLPLLAAWQGPLAVLFGLPLVFLFVKRELGHPLYGLIAMALFGVSSQYKEAVTWFAASFAVLALDTVLLALLAAQRWRQTGKAWHLAPCILWTALAPCWFASGILAGPLCVLYLLPDAIDLAKVRRVGAAVVRSLVALAPMLGTGLFLAITLPRNKETIMRTEHYDKKTALEAFDAGIGLKYTVRSLVDNLLIGSFGISGDPVPIWAMFILLGLFVAAGVTWWYLAPDRRLLWLGLGFVLTTYVLTYSARSGWPYTQVCRWGRYQLFPHLGLVFFFVGGLAHWEDWLFKPWAWNWDRSNRWLTCLVLARVFELVFVVQMPRSLGTFHDAEQMADLQRIEAVDALCRQHGIDAATAQKALRPHKEYDFIVQHSSDKIQGWDFLRGSAAPKAMSPEEARQLLHDEVTRLLRQRIDSEPAPN